MRNTGLSVELAVLLVMIGTGASGNDQDFGIRSEKIMNLYLPLYSWIRQDAAICLARIVRIASEPGSPGQEVFTIQLNTTETLAGKHEATRSYQFELPVSEFARLKFPDPVWSRVTLREGINVLLVAPAAPNTPAPPLFIEELPAPPELKLLRAVIHEEKAKTASPARVERYLAWVEHGSVAEKLFGGEALAKDPLAEVDRNGRVAAAFSRAFGSGQDVYVRVSLGTWMWENIFPRTNADGEAEIINAAIRSVKDPAEGVRRLSLDHLLQLDSQQWTRPGLLPTADLVNALDEMLKRETAQESRSQIQKTIDALRR